MFTLRSSTNSLILCLLLSYYACKQAPKPPALKELDSLNASQPDTNKHAIVDHQESSKANSLPDPHKHVETPEEKKERLFFARNHKNPLDFKHGAIRFYTDSNGRKWMDVPGDTIDIEVKE